MNQSETGEIEFDFDRDLAMRAKATGLDPSDLEVVLGELDYLAAACADSGQTLLVTNRLVAGRADDPVFMELVESSSELDGSLVTSGQVVPPEALVSNISETTGQPSRVVMQALTVWGDAMEALLSQLAEQLGDEDGSLCVLTDIEVRSEEESAVESTFQLGCGRIAADLRQLPDALLELRGLRRRPSSEPLSLSPAVRNHWIWVTQPQYVYELDGSIRPSLDPGFVSDPGSWWTCNKNTRAGDLIMLYRSHEDRGIVAVFQAMSDAYSIVGSDEARAKGWKWGCDYQAIALLDNFVPLEAIRADKDLEDLPALRASFQSRAYAVDPDHWAELLRLAIDRNPSNKMLAKLSEGTKGAPEELPWEREWEVETWLESNLDVLEPFGLPLALLARQRRLAVSGGIIDLLCEREDTGALVVIELKGPGVHAGRRTLGQVLGYMGSIRAELPDRDVEGVVIAGGCEPDFELALEYAPSVRFIHLNELRPQ